MPPARRSRPATYGSALRIARLVYELSVRPYGWRFQEIQRTLGISERTVLRYLTACRRALRAPDGGALIVVRRNGARRTLRLADTVRTPDSTAYQAMAYYLALSVLQFLDGTVLKDGVADLWERFRRSLAPSQQRRLAHFEKKFFHVPYAMKDYRSADDILDRLVRALVDQHTLRVEYAGLWRGEVTCHEFDPYTLAMYRGGLYLIGRSHRYGRIVYLAVERIRAVELLSERFPYPARYSPEKHTQGTFGIVEGDETRVEVEILTREGKELLQARRLHPTQRFREQADGTTRLTMTVRGTRELVNWILGLGPHVRVVSPPELRDEIASQLRQALALYA